MKKALDIQVNQKDKLIDKLKNTVNENKDSLDIINKITEIDKLIKNSVEILKKVSIYYIIKIMLPI